MYDIIKKAEVKIGQRIFGTASRALSDTKYVRYGVAIETVRGTAWVVVPIFKYKKKDELTKL